jgi:hypothetical protein
MTMAHEEHLQRVLAVVRKIDKDAASANRAALLAVQNGGEIPLDLLGKKRYELVSRLLGDGDARRVSVPKLSKEARESREPPRPEGLLGALQDRVYPTSGRLIESRAVIRPNSKNLS